MIIDEAQEYTTDQEAALKYTVTDSDNPQTIMCGTPPTPTSSRTVFTDYRDDVLTELRLFYDMSGGYFQKGLVQKITAEK